jgi:acyl transferase domain-containing protein
MADSNTSARQEVERKALLRKALEAIDSLQTKLDTVERARTEPIAIVGLSCRLPGSPDPDAFWRVLSGGVDAVREVPSDRWDKDAHRDLDPSAPGEAGTLCGGFLDRVDLFDAAFFGISGREAESMDPQQRLLLEVAWEALENAGIATSRLRGSSTGVFIGITTSDYARLAVANDSVGLDVYTATGGALNVAAGRLSFVFGLNGPSLAVDTACSSSLVAVHLACQSLRARECDFALTGGVNVLLTPEPFICLAKWGMLAPDGRCKTFDERADGFVRAEGCGIIALKRLSDALAAGDRVLALIRGTAVNQDGASSGLTVPNGLAQQAVIRSALEAARLQPHDVDYVEAHGTGTTLGDPIELEALAAALGKNRPTDRPLRVGSVKTNVGHLESAAGIAGLIKVVLSLVHEEIPRQVHFHKLNSRVALGNAPIEIPADTIAWPRSGRPRIAGVSAFGFSGTNAHIILQEAPITAAASPRLPDRSAHLLTLSASSDSALRKLSQVYAEHLAKEPECSLPDICHTAAVGRSALSYRLAFPAADTAAAKELLVSFAQRKATPDIASGRIRSDSRVAFLFTGQGAQYATMGRDLYEREPGFRDAFDECGRLLVEHLDRPLQEIIGYDADGPASAGMLDETCYTQPAIFAVEYALASLWRSWGIEPAAILGHSLGEYVGACVAGVLSLEDALRLVVVRSRLMQALPRNGTMGAVLAGEDWVRAKIAPYTDSVSIAAINSPQNTVISGRANDVHAVLEQARRDGVETKPLMVSHAFHSPLVEPMLDEFEQCARSAQFQAPVVDMILNVTGSLLDEKSPLDAFYWRRHAREPVQFAKSIRTLHARGIRAFLEIGPAPVLIGMGRQCVENSETMWLASLRKGRGDWPQMLSSLGTLFVLGAKPDWNAYDRPYSRRRVSLPTYPFQRERHWLPVPNAPDFVRNRTQTSGHPMPDSASKKQDVLEAVEDCFYEPRWVLKETDAESRPQVFMMGTWIVLRDRHGFGDALCAQLRQNGASCLSVDHAEQLSQATDALMTIRPDVSADYDAMFDAAARLGPLISVIHLWSLDALDPEKADSTALREAQRLGPVSVLHLVQALDRAKQTTSPRLWLISRGAQPVAEDPAPIAVLQSPLWGLGRAIAIENEDFWGGQVDLDPVDTPGTAAALLLRQLVERSAEDQTAFRGGCRYVLRLGRRTRMTSRQEQIRVRRDATYLITGGLGGIGLLIARWLVARGARHLVLVGRSSLPAREDWDNVAKGTVEDERVTAIRDLESMGANIRTATVDMGNETSVLKLVSEFLRTDAVPLCGVFHAAGITQNELLANQSSEQMLDVLSGKMVGGWLLHRLLADIPLELFVLFSSSSALLSSPMLGSYSAANAFLDALAHHRRATGKVALSVNWGPWAEAGMAARLLTEEESRRDWLSGAINGVSMLSTQQALRALERLLEDGAVQTSVMSIDWAAWQRWSHGSLAVAPYLSLLISGSDSGLARTRSDGESRERILAAQPETRSEMVRSYLAKRMARILKVPVASVETEKPMPNMGFDSLMSIELKNQIEMDLGVGVAMARLIQGPTILELTNWLMDLLDTEAFAGAAVASPANELEEGVL